MALHDYGCAQCAFGLTDVFRTALQGARRDPPHCPHCHVPMQWIPQAGFDMKTDGEGRKGMQKFRVHRQIQTRDGLQHIEETIDSVHKLRQLEKDSEQRYRDGEGEPMRFRGYSQNASNNDVGAFGTSGVIGERAYDSGQPLKKSSKIGVARHGQDKPRVKVARGGGGTALKG